MLAGDERQKESQGKFLAPQDRLCGGAGWGQKTRFENSAQIRIKPKDPYERPQDLAVRYIYF
jgi:hypothetical protein